ncbi:MAG: DUF4124 domain-containing protein [Chromatiaceae bacterium]
MKVFMRLVVWWAVAVLPFAVLAEQIYKSIDASGAVTYSAEPPLNASTVESLEIPPRPSEEATKAALERAREVQKEAGAGYEATMDRRQQEAEARAKAQEEARTAEQARRATDATDEPDGEPVYIWYRGDRIRPQPPHPPHPPHPPRPPHPPLRGAP